MLCYLLFCLRFIHFIIRIFFFLIYFLLKYNCFTEFCCFLSNLDMNQPSVYIYPRPFQPPSHLPPHSTPQKEPLFEFPEPHSKFPLAIYFTYGNVGFHVTRKEDFLLAPLEYFSFCVPSNKDNNKEEKIHNYT